MEESITIKGIDGILNNLKLLNPKVSNILIEAVNIGGQMVATEARHNLEKPGGTGFGGKHIITGHLQQSTVPKEAKATSVGIEGGTKATMNYAIYEEVRHPFLFPALVTRANDIQRKAAEIMKRLGL